MPPPLSTLACERMTGVRFKEGTAGGQALLEAVQLLPAARDLSRQPVNLPHHVRHQLPALLQYRAICFGKMVSGL